MLDMCNSISVTRFCYSISDTLYLMLDICHLDTYSLKFWYMLDVTCQMFLDIWFSLHDTKACYYLQKYFSFRSCSVTCSCLTHLHPCVIFLFWSSSFFKSPSFVVYLFSEVIFGNCKFLLYREWMHRKWGRI